jgi:hypothetical protein
VRLGDKAAHRAGSWDQTRRVVYKAEAFAKGPKTRFVVTSKVATRLTSTYIASTGASPGSESISSRQPASPFG